MDAFCAGQNCPVYFQVSGQGNVALLAVTAHSLDISKLVYDVSNVRHNGDTARIAGKRDVSGSASMDFDSDSPPYLNPPYLVEGVSGIMLFYYSAAALGRPIQIPIIIEKIHYEMQVASQTKYNVDVKMNKLAGYLVYPTA